MRFVIIFLKNFKKTYMAYIVGAIKLLPTMPLSSGIRMIQMKLEQVIPKDRSPQRTSHYFSLKMNVCSVKVVSKEHIEEKRNLSNV